MSTMVVELFKFDFKHSSTDIALLHHYVNRIPVRVFIVKKRTFNVATSDHLKLIAKIT